MVEIFFLDTDVVLDKILARQPWVNEAKPLWKAIQEKKIVAVVAAITPINIAYIARKSLSLPTLKTTLEDLYNSLQIAPIDETTLRDALISPITDYEDAVQHECALAAGADALVTRNLADFQNATLPIFSPPDLEQHLASQT